MVSGCRARKLAVSFSSSIAPAPGGAVHVVSGRAHELAVSFSSLLLSHCLTKNSALPIAVGAPRCIAQGANRTYPLMHQPQPYVTQLIRQKLSPPGGLENKPVFRRLTSDFQ